jgi:hypothetical protein
MPGAIDKQGQHFDQIPKRRKPMKPMNIMLILLFGLILAACGSGGTTEPDQNTADLSTQEQAELVASALSAQQGGVEDDITTATQAATGASAQRLQLQDTLGYTISVNVDFYDEWDNLQDTYDPDTTDRIDYQSLIQGRITNGTGFFRELSIDNRSDFSVRQILTGIAWINGTHTNHSSYDRTQPLTQADVHYQLDCELILTDITVDLDAADTFPESGTIEGTIAGSYQRVAPTWQQTSQFNFHFVATYLGDNTAEVEFDDGTIFAVHLGSGTVENLE